MKVYGAKKLNYRDELARRNRLFFILKLTGFIAAFVGIVGGGTYFLFFTEKLEIKDITINGLKTLDRERIMSEVNRQLEYKKFNYLHTRRNILFFDGSELEANLLASNPVLKGADMRRKLPHKIVLDIVEREPAGIWCSGNPPADGCRYFDKDMNTWGPAAKSSGFLFLTVEDARSREAFAIEEDFFRSINQVVNGLPGLTVKTVLIPEDSFDEFRVYTDKGFYIIFSLDSDLVGQMEIWKIFWEEKGKDPAFAAQYIDLRIDGRIYYR